jgi:hypothetical protein
MCCLELESGSRRSLSPNPQRQTLRCLVEIICLGYAIGGPCSGTEAVSQEQSRARKDGAARKVTEHLTGYIRITADSMEQAKSLLIGNPQFEAGGTVEIRELPRSD